MQIIEAISDAIRSSSELVKLLDVDPGTSTNRTVKSFFIFFFKKMQKYVAEVIIVGVQ